MLSSFTLKNGVKVATFSIPQMKSAFLGVAVKGGSIFDTQKDSGRAHFMEHILVQGIPSYPTVEEFSDYVEGIAGSYGAATYRQFIKFSVGAPARYLEEMIRISSEVLFSPLFPADALERERNAVLEEIRQRQDTLWYKNSRFFAETRFKKGHPLRLDGGGIAASVKKLSGEDLIDYWSTFFHPKNTYLVVVGGFKNKELKNLIKNYFGARNSKSTFPGFPKLTNNSLSGRNVVIREDKDLQTCYVDLSFPSISDADSFIDHIKQAVIKNILGKLRSSRLYRLLRQKRGLVYHVDFNSVSFTDFGYSYVSFQAVEKNVEEVVSLISAELLNFYEYGPTEQELEFAKNYDINRAFMQFDHPSGIADWLEGDLMWERKIYTPEEYAKMVESVDLKSLKEFMQKYWDFGKLNLTVQGSIKNSKENMVKFDKIVERLK